MEENAKICILHIAECAGGVERYLHSLLKYLDHTRLRNILVCSQNFDIASFSGIADAVEQIEMHHEISPADLASALKIRAIIQKHHPDIVYAHSSKAGALARMANIGLKNRCIYNPHGWAFNMQCGSKKRTVYRAMEKIMAHFCDKIICISDFEKQSALDNNICKADHLVTIFNGIDIAEYENADESLSRKQLDIPEDAFVVGTVGRLSKQKAPDVFIQMAHAISEQIPNAYFVMVGSGELEQAVREEAQSLGIQNRLRITGWVNHPLSYVRLFDIAVLLSRWEGFGLVIPEYMLCGKPVVATAVDAIPNLISDHTNGLLVPSENGIAASSAVMELYKNEQLKNALVTQASEDVYQKFDVQRVAREHEKLFDSILE